MRLSLPGQLGAADEGVAADRLAGPGRAGEHAGASMQLDRPARMVADIGSGAAASCPRGLGAVAGEAGPRPAGRHDPPPPTSEPHPPAERPSTIRQTRPPVRTTLG